MTWQVDDFRFVEPSQLLHDSEPGIEPGDITTRQNLPRPLDAASEAIAHPGRNDRIEEIRRIEVGNQDIADDGTSRLPLGSTSISRHSWLAVRDQVAPACTSA